MPEERARQVFVKSAQFANYIADNGRIIKPAFAAPPPPEPDPAPDLEKDKNRGGGEGGNDGHHPFIQGLLKTLPAPESDWPLAAQAKWLQTAASVFGLIYKSGDGSIKVDVETT